jgi:uncharacterized membrane protein
VKLETAFMWLAPFCFLSLRSPWSIMLIPLVLERFLSSSPNHWGTSHHYTAPIAPIVAMSAGDALARIASRMRPANSGTPRAMAWIAAVCVLLSSLLPGHLFIWRLFTPTWYQSTEMHRAGYRALAHVPPDASVVAQAAALPHLTHRQHVYMLDEHARDAEYLVVGSELSPWPAPAYPDLARIAESRRRRGDTVLFEEEGWLVLRR